MSRNEIGNDFEKYTTAKTLDQKAACKQCHKKDYESFSYSALTQYISDRIVLITLFSVSSDIIRIRIIHILCPSL